MLRIDVDDAAPYAIPPDNPYVDRARLAGRDLAARSAQSVAVEFRPPQRRSLHRRRGRSPLGGDRLPAGAGRRREQLRLALPRSDPLLLAGGGLRNGWPGATNPGVQAHARVRGDRAGTSTAGETTPISAGPTSTATTAPALSAASGWWPASRSRPTRRSPRRSPTTTSCPSARTPHGEVYVVMASGRVYRIALAG